MDFKVAKFYQSIEYKNKKQNPPYLLEEYNDFYCLKFFKETKTKTKGVQKTDGSLDSTDNFIISHNGKSLVELRYIFIDKLKKRIFYTTSNSELNKILRDYFSYTNNIEYEVDIDKLESITKISLEIHRNHQIDWINPNATISSLEELEFDCEPDKTTVHMEYATPTRLLKGKSFQEIINKYQANNAKLTMRGFDKEGNILLVTEKVQLLVEINIEFKDAVELDSIPLSVFCSQLRNKTNDI